MREILIAVIVAPILIVEWLWFRSFSGAILALGNHCDNYVPFGVVATKR
jgi:hypothetical protein